ncbi:MAG: Mrp/NBP35 family ATP-binding protein [Methanobacteriota archaeon]
MHGNADAVETQRKIKKNLDNIGHKVVVMSGKGGVGKTTVATNLAFALAAKKFKVGLLDADIHGPNVPKMLGVGRSKVTQGEGGMQPIEVRPGLKVMSMAFVLDSEDAAVIWRGPMKMSIINQFLGDVEWGKLDYLIVDLPPGTGDEPLSIAQQVPGAGAIIVTTPQEVALLDARKTVTFARQLGMPVMGIVENMAGLTCPHCGKGIALFKVGGGEAAAKQMGVPFLGRLPIEPSIVDCGDDGVPFVTRKTNCPSTVKAFSGIVDGVVAFNKDGGGNGKKD